MATLFIVSACALLYAYLGYPLVLRGIVWLRGPRPVRRQPIEPPVTLIVSAFNEAQVIRAKLQNALSLDYPRDKLEVLVVSDASDDATDATVLEHADQGVVLVRQGERRGKTAGLNLAVPQARGEIVVFSDANAMYEPDAIRQLVRNFADPQVGCVTGEARYLEEHRSTADVGERAYWDYEIRVKRLETSVGSMVGGDGAIYAIRRHLWQALPENAINDFLNPLQIVAAGHRNVYEPEAICHEETAGDIRREYRRRVRIVSRSWRAVFQAPGVLNPFRVGLFTLSVVSHKVLRWFSGIFLIAGAVATAGLLVTTTPLHRPAVIVALAALAAMTVLVPAGRRLLALGWYFVTINMASLVGVWRGTFGNVSGVWTTPRQADLGAAAFSRLGRLLSVVGVLFIVTAILLWAVANRHHLVPAAFWTSIGLLAFVYVGYPVLMWIWREVAARPTAIAPVTPHVCLFITAHNEAAVMREKIENSLALDYPPGRLEVVVASDGSTDGTNGIVSACAGRGVRLLAFPQRGGKIAAINGGMRLVDREIVVFSDANTFLERGAVRTLVARFADPDVGAVSGDVVLVGDRAALGPPEDLYYLYERWLQQAESDVGSMIGADGALYAVRRDLFVPPADDTILDDMFIPVAVCRQGRRVVFEGSARAYEQGSRSAREEFSRKSRVVAGAVQLVGRAGSLMPWTNLQFMFSLVSHKLLRWVSPLFAATALVTALGLANTASTYMAMATLQGGVLFAGLLGCFERLRRLRPIGIAHYFCLVQAAALVGLVRGIVGSQPSAWRRFEHTPVHDVSSLARPGDAT